MGSEETIIRSMELPGEQGWVYMPEANVLIFDSRLDCEARLQAVNEMGQAWRRRHLRLVESS